MLSCYLPQKCDKKGQHCFNCCKYATKMNDVLLSSVLLDVIETEGDDFEDDLKEDFGPVILR